MRSDEDYLKDIVTAASHIQNIVVGLDEEIFRSTIVVYSATLYQLMIIGEAVSKISEGLKARYPQVPWPDIAGFRHVIVHAYFGLNLERVWKTTVNLKFLPHPPRF